MSDNQVSYKTVLCRHVLTAIRKKYPIIWVSHWKSACVWERVNGAAHKWMMMNCKFDVTRVIQHIGNWLPPSPVAWLPSAICQLNNHLACLQPLLLPHVRCSLQWDRLQILDPGFDCSTVKKKNAHITLEEILYCT